MFKKIVFPNGLRVIAVPQKNTLSVTVLVLVGAGSKYEKREENGISHFLEHMFFRGTKKRPSALKVAETLDKVGGVYNAFTSKEYTGYWAKVDSKHLDLALDWVSDILLNSKIESKEIKKERGVIIEELNMYLDTPTRYIGDLWEELLYGDQPAGWKTIGEKENILKFKRSNFLNYLKSHYSSLNTIVCLAGNIENKKLKIKSKKLQFKIKKYFRNIRTISPRKKIKVSEKQKEPQALLHFKETDQTHLALGVRAYNLFSPEKYAQGILATILGGNMSSRLFINVREKQGLAYYIHTDSDLYTDSGYLATFAGVPHQEVGKTIKLIIREYKKIKKKGISLGELKKAKDYLKGSLALGLESSDAKASFYSTQELLAGEILTMEEKFKMIDRVTLKDLRRVAKEIFRKEKLNLALIGPHKSDIVFKEYLTL